MDQFKGTVYRQTMFAEFELAMGKMAENGQALTADALCQKYHELNKLYFGPDMVSDDQIALEWARIPHFFYNYYVFQYATGFSAAVAIANRILKEGAPAVADYKKFLSGGCSTDPISLLKIAGVDMSSPSRSTAPWPCSASWWTRWSSWCKRHCPIQAYRAAARYAWNDKHRLFFPHVQYRTQQGGAGFPPVGVKLLPT